jgi:hypothetical protein
MPCGERFVSCRFDFFRVVQDKAPKGTILLDRSCVLSFKAVKGVRVMAVEAPRTAKNIKPTIFYFSDQETPGEGGNPVIDDWYSAVRARIYPSNPSSTSSAHPSLIALSRPVPPSVATSPALPSIPAPSADAASPLAELNVRTVEQPRREMRRKARHVAPLVRLVRFSGR